MSTQELHTNLSVECFNKVWGFLDKESRSEEDDRLMREMVHASLFHWLMRDDHTATNISVGLWQVSRVHAVLGDGHTALKYALECVKLSHDLLPFYLSYAHEAAARAYKVLDATENQRHHHEIALSLYQKITEEENLDFLKADIAEVEVA